MIQKLPWTAENTANPVFSSEVAQRISNNDTTLAVSSAGVMPVPIALKRTPTAPWTILALMANTYDLNTWVYPKKWRLCLLYGILLMHGKQSRFPLRHFMASADTATVRTIFVADVQLNTTLPTYFYITKTSAVKLYSDNGHWMCAAAAQRVPRESYFPLLSWTMGRNDGWYRTKRPPRVQRMVGQ